MKLIFQDPLWGRVTGHSLLRCSRALEWSLRSMGVSTGRGVDNTVAGWVTDYALFAVRYLQSSREPPGVHEASRRNA